MKTVKSQKPIVQKSQFIEPVCDFRYLKDLVNGKTSLINGIMEIFLKQIPEDLNSINKAIENLDYKTIRSYIHTMKSSVSIMGISILNPILREMEHLGVMASGIEKIKKMNKRLNLICKQAIKEIENEKLNYVQ